MMQQQAELSKDASMRDSRFSEVWKRYGGEIEREVQVVPVYGRSKQVYDKAAEIVKGRHADELAEERIQERMAAMKLGGTERGSGGGLPNVARDPIDELWDDDTIPYVEFQKRSGLRPKDIRQYLEKRRITPAAWAEQVRKGTVIYDSVRGTTIHNVD